jgi:glutamate/aspartate transport system substrate-binding protein
MRRIAVTALLALLGSAIPHAGAQEATGTLAKLKRTATITLGVRDGSVPFSYLDDQQRYIGYSVDLCLKVVDALRTQLALPGLKVKMNPVTSANRIPLIANGTIDLECGSTTNNHERQQQAAFAPTMFVVANRLLSKKSSGIRSLADMKDKTLVVSAGTTGQKLMTVLNARRRLGMKIVVGKDHPESFLMLDTGRAQAFANDDVLLAAQVAGARAPGDYQLSAEALSVEPYAIMMRRGDPQFKAAVDSALHKFYGSGQFAATYAKWFTSPIPPRGINLNFPMPPALKAVIAKPTDSGDPAAYALQ